MAYSIRCTDAGLDCPGAFTTEGAAELMRHAQLHLTETHPGLAVPDEQLRQLIKSA